VSTPEKKEIIDAVKNGDLDAVAAVTSAHPRRLRHLITIMYEQDTALRRRAATALARASTVHPKMVKKLVARLVWAMTNESHTYLPTAPEAVLAIAEVNPDLVAPFAADLIRLSADTSLNAKLCDTLRRIAAYCPGKIGQGMTKSLGEHIRYGGQLGRRDRQ
jgi:hypothetical protein